MAEPDGTESTGRPSKSTMNAPFARFWWAVVVAWAVVLVPRLTAQQPALAGATRPNLKVLQAVPESQLFLLMNLVADSLGVRCDFCHLQANPDVSKTPSNVGGWNFASDDKPQKQKARDMMRMVMDLNRTQFGGTSRVTCYTCHRGATQPSRLPPLPPPAGSVTTAAPVPLPSADQVWANYVAAVGPLGTSAPGTGTIFSGWDDRPEGRYGSIEIVMAGTDRYRATLTTPAGKTTQGFDGETAWVSANDRVQKLTGEDAARLRRIAMHYQPIKDRPANLQVGGLATIDGRQMYVATARVDVRTGLALYFDVVTGLLRREIMTTETVLLPLEEQTDYDDYRTVNGVQFPFLVRTTDGAAYDLVTKVFLQIRRNVPVDEALFRAPGGGTIR